MKMNCGVIRDLLPLYAEKMTGNESDVLIREHLAECQNCSAYLKKLQNPIDNVITKSASASGNSLKLIQRGIRSRKITAVLFSVLLMFVALITAFSHIVKPNYISYKNSGITVTESADGDVYARFSDNVTSCRLIKLVNEDNQSVVEITAWTSLWDKFIGKTTPSVLISSAAAKTDIAYFNDLSMKDDNVAVVYGTDTQENSIVCPRLVLGYYFIAAFIAALIIGLAYLIFKKNEKLSLICKYLFYVPISYMLAHLIITTRFVSFSVSYDFILNVIAALAIYGVLIYGTSLFRKYRQDMITEKTE